MKTISEKLVMMMALVAVSSMPAFADSNKEALDSCKLEKNAAAVSQVKEEHKDYGNSVQNFLINREFRESKAIN